MMCQHTDQYTDRISGDRVCRECGEVLEERIFHCQDLSQQDLYQYPEQHPKSDFGTLIDKNIQSPYAQKLRRSSKRVLSALISDRNTRRKYLLHHLLESYRNRFDLPNPIFVTTSHYLNQFMNRSSQWQWSWDSRNILECCLTLAQGILPEKTHFIRTNRPKGFIERLNQMRFILDLSAKQIPTFQEKFHSAGICLFPLLKSHDISKPYFNQAMNFAYKIARALRFDLKSGKTAIIRARQTAIYSLRLCLYLSPTEIKRWTQWKEFIIDETTSIFASYAVYLHYKQHGPLIPFHVIGIPPISVNISKPISRLTAGEAEQIRGLLI